jgi:hypothetical protein
MTTITRRGAFAALFAVAATSAFAARDASALTIRGPGGRPGGFRPIDPGIGNGQQPYRPIDPGIGNGRPNLGWHSSRRAVIGGHGNGPDPQPNRPRWRNSQGGLLGGLNPQAPTPYGYPGYVCHPRRRMAGLC